MGDFVNSTFLSGRFCEQHGCMAKHVHSYKVRLSKVNKNNSDSADQEGRIKNKAYLDNFYNQLNTHVHAHMQVKGMGFYQQVPGEQQATMRCHYYVPALTMMSLSVVDDDVTISSRR